MFLKHPDDFHVYSQALQPGTRCLWPLVDPKWMLAWKRPGFDGTLGRLRIWWAKSYTRFPSPGTACRKGRPLHSRCLPLVPHKKQSLSAAPVAPGTAITSSPMLARWLSSKCAGWGEALAVYGQGPSGECRLTERSLNLGCFQQFANDLPFFHRHA